MLQVLIPDQLRKEFRIELGMLNVYVFPVLILSIIFFLGFRLYQGEMTRQYALIYGLVFLFLIATICF